MSLLNVLPECYVDTNLTEYLLGDMVNHQHSCTKVIASLKSVFGDKFAVGIIDNDDNSQEINGGYVAECKVLATRGHLTLRKHPDNPHYLITIAPAIDRFIVDCATETKVKTEDYGIPSDLKGFTQRAKSVQARNDKAFKGLFSAISGAQEINAMKATLKYLLANTYKADTSIIVTLFNQ